ncbi:kinesin-related protein 4 isoform X2 [Microplitis demolitor]|uniref:kinesin-related protein 4 isoform X2 n=1 Tax=Microplitis demolitor TaxID=69319 RepID=UPI0006D50571|nr:kinesin-related protein 4 isoform X2 [Microplitis demolitor]
MSDNIKVAIKVRPLIKREKDDRLVEQWITENNCIQQIDPESNRRADARFHFDYIFGTEANNQDVFDQTVKPIVQAAMNGFNGTIFAYGQTGSGKTYTMMGNKEERGVIPLTVNYIFNYIHNDSTRKYLLRVSYIEIYNEKINDLLDKNNQDLKVKEDFQGRINVDCKEEVINSPECVLHAMRKGEKSRRIGETNMNERSSRSHTIFRFTIESCRVDDPDGATTEAQLNLIDLAGSERARQTGATGERFNEGKHINLSLSALALVIKQLSEPGTSFINYRDSKLTRILQPSLGGNALTTIICAVTPAAIDETQCTLDFAVRAKGIKNKPQVNETVSEKALLKRLMKHQAMLEAELESAQTKLAENEKSMLQQRIELLSRAIVSKPVTEDEKNKARRRRTWAPGNSMRSFTNKSSDFGLPTIAEFSSDSHQRRHGIHDQSINHVDLNNQSFHTIYPDFELQLIKDQNEKNRFSTVSDDGEVLPTVTVRDQNFEDDDKTPEPSPEKKCQCVRSPSTPKIELRQRLEMLKSEYHTLREFSTLEKQLFQEDGLAAMTQSKYERELEFVKKSLQDTEQVCMDLRKNYSELQSEHAILSEDHQRVQQECQLLREEKKSLETLRDNYPSVEAEKNEYKNKMNEALRKLKILEDEANSNAYELELLKVKHKKREKELEESLTLAWKDFIDPSEKQKLTDVVYLQSVINDLTAKLEGQLPSSPVTSDNDELTSRLMEMENQLQRSAEEKQNLADQLEEFSRQLTELSEATTISGNEQESLVADYEKRIQEHLERIAGLEETIASKVAENEDLVSKNYELTCKLTEAVEKIKNNENAIDGMKKFVDDLQSDVELKATEILSLKARVEEMDVIKEQVFSSDLIQDDDEEFKLVLATQDSQESLGNMLDNSFKSVIEMPGNEDHLLDSNLLEEQKIKIAELESLLEDQKNELMRREKLLNDKSIELKITIESYSDKINELQVANDKLKDQLSGMQSEKTLSEGEKTAMQLLLKEKEQELQEFLKVKNQLAFTISQNEELEKITTDLRKQLNEKLLELEEKERHDFESEIKNLKEYTANLQNLYRDVQIENDNLKQQLDKVDVSLKIDTDKTSQDHDAEAFENTPDSSVSPLEKNWTGDHQMINDSKNNYRISEVKQLKAPKPLSESTSEIKISKNTTQDDAEISSIFANGSYFDNLNISSTQSDLNFTDSNFSQNYSSLGYSVNMTTLEVKSDIEDSQNNLNATDFELINILKEKSAKECENIVRKLLKIKNTLVEDNDKLKNSLQAKANEFDAINRDMADFKSGMESLKETIDALNSENEETSTKLEASNHALTEMELKYNQMKNELEAEIQRLVNENRSMENIIKNNEDKIKDLVTENLELTNDLTDRLEELSRIQEMKALEFDHECKYRDQFSYYIQRLEILEKENIDLSNKYMELIDEYETVKDTYDNLRANSLAGKLDINKLASPDKNLLVKSPNARARRSCSPSPSLDKSIHNILEQYDENESLVQRARELESQVDELKGLNKKLANIKLTSCKNCAHLAELNECRRTMKRDIKTMNQRYRELENKFKKERAEGEILRNKVEEDVDVSVFHATMNESIFEDVNVSYAEAEIQKISSELESIRGDYQKLSNLYEEKCSETDKLHNGNGVDVSPSVTVSPKSSKRDGRFEKIQNDLQRYKDDLQQVNQSICSIESKLKKFQNVKMGMEKEVDSLKAMKEMLEDKLAGAERSAAEAQSRISELEEQISRLSQQLEQAGVDNKDLHEVTKELECQVDDLKRAKEDYEKTIQELRSLLAEVEDKNVVLQTQVEELKATNQEESPLKIELDKYKQDVDSFAAQVQELRNQLRSSEDSKELLKEELELVKSTPPPERQQIDLLTTTIDEYKQKVESLEISVKDLREKVDHYARENIELADKLATIQSQDLNVTDNKMEVCDESFSGDKNKDNEDLEALRSRLIKEISSLKPANELKDLDLDNKKVGDVFCIFLESLLSKEKEIIHLINRRSAQEKNKLEEEKKELIDAEKRVSLWAKELEADNERLQTDLTKHETKINLLQNQISKLESSLMDSEHEKQLMNEKMTVMETDFNTLQQDYDKIAQTGSTSSAQEREKIIQEALEVRDADHQKKLKEQEQKYYDKLRELENALECCRAKNSDLAKSLEGLEVNDQQWKNIIDMKTAELNKANSTIQRLQTELANLMELYNHTKEDNQSKSSKIEEITELLKIKCDKMSEYKTQLETIGPDYELLKQQALERKIRLEEYKSEVDSLREQNNKEVTLLKDKLDAEQIMSAGLTKQLAEITNRCTANQIALDQLKVKYEELEKENERLVRKVRNSTSKVTVSREMEMLKDENRKLANDLEGASNRIKDLQSSKTQLMTEYVELRGKYELTCQERNHLQITLDTYKATVNSSETFELRSKYDMLIMEKNLVALELEEKRSTVGQYEKKINELMTKNQELMKKNKELDEEMDDMLGKINELDEENTVLQDKIYQMENEKPQSNAESGMDINNELKMLRKSVEKLKQENEDLKLKLNSKCDVDSISSRTSSPTLANVSRQRRRSELYNQNRPLELADELVDDTSDSQCERLKKTIQELEAVLVLRNAKITALSMQLQAGFFPYEQKIKEYEEVLEAYKKQNEVLRDKLRGQLQAECERCTKWKSNHREMGVQTDAEIVTEKKNLSKWMDGAGIGIVTESAIEARTIAKLKAEKAKLHEILQKRVDKSQEYKAYIKHLENQLELRKPNIPDKTNKNASKENIHVNVLGQSQLIPHRFWYE